MNDFYSLASTRRSIRKYKDVDVPVSDIVECVKIATTAPSGCNSQCWKFVVIHDKKILDDLSKIIEVRQVEELKKMNLEYDDAYLQGRIKALTFFRKAPVCVAVFMTEYDYYDRKYEDSLKANGYSYAQRMDLYGNPDLLSIGAAIQNFLLAAHEKGYGACWMNDPLVAREEISKYLGMTEEGKLISLIPVGLAEYTPREKKYKKTEDVLRIIE